jgi:hypothetical protein
MTPAPSLRRAPRGPRGPSRRRRRQGRRTALLVAALLLVVAAGAFAAVKLTKSSTSGHARAAGTPALATDLPCYLADRPVLLRASNLPAGSTYTVALDGRTLGHGTVGSDGTLRGRLSSGVLARGATHVAHTVTLRDGATALSAPFYTTQFTAGFAPTAGDPATLHVRFSIYGFGIGPAAPKDPVPREVYLHYVAPGGRPEATLHVGRTHGFCGSIPVTRRHRLFPFTLAAAGRWQLQFDLVERYSPLSAPRVVRELQVG